MSSKMATQIILLILASSFAITAATHYTRRKTGEDTLVLLHVLFRHGNRTPDAIPTLYTTNPYKDYDYYPYGQGELINEGKKKEYSIGTTLRKKYGKFLGSTYTPHVIAAQSTAYNRTKMSLQLVLASLYPPIESQIWNPKLFWQPIPYNYAPLNNDPLLFPIVTAAFKTRYVEYLATAEYASLISIYQSLLDYLSKNVGSTCSTFKHIYLIYDNLRTQEEYGLPLPEWAKSIYPDTLREAGNHIFQTVVATRELKQYMTGCLFSKIASDTIQKIGGSEYLKRTKLFLYSAHDINLVTFLMTLGLYDYASGSPPYGSYLVTEVHNLGEGYGIQIFFQNYTQNEPLLLTLPGCSDPCPLEDFIKLTKEYYPDSDYCHGR